MIPLVAGGLATPIYAIANRIAITSPAVLITFALIFGLVYSYASTWRRLIRLNRETASNPAA
jgi:hypothetical protein